jgi:hypothetical protein
MLFARFCGRGITEKNANEIIGDVPMVAPPTIGG